MTEEQRQEPEQEQEQVEERLPPVPPTPQGPVEEPTDVKCGNPNCGAQFTFPIQSNVAEFAFTCSNCGAQNRWQRGS